MSEQRPTPSSVARAREIVSEIADYLNDEAVIEFTNTVALALDAQREVDAQVAEQWEDSTQDIDCGVTMVSVLKSGRPDTDGGVVIQEVDKLEPWEQRQAEILGEYREVARREERRIVAAAIREGKD